MVDIDDENKEIIERKKDFWHASLTSLRARSKKRIVKTCVLVQEEDDYTSLCAVIS